MKNTPHQTQQDHQDHHAKLAHLESRLEHLEHKLINKAHKIQRLLDKRFHYLYIFVAFVGVTMVWYAVWDIISETPFIHNHWVAGSIGLIVLLLLGKFFDRLV